MKRILCAWLIFLLLLPMQHAAAEQSIPCYALGDGVEDFSLTTSTGEQVSLYGLLSQHKAVLLNFWFADCGPCRYEFPFLQKAYEMFNRDIAVLAISPYDSSEAIERYRNALGLSFMMAPDTAGITDRFVDYGFPTSVVIDRNGILCYAECGAQTSTNAFVRLLTPYILEDYDEPLLLSSIPSIIQPVAPDIRSLNAALNVPGGSLSFIFNIDFWPWVLSDDGSYIVSSNSGIDNSSAFVETSLYCRAGDVLSFRVYTSSEEGRDIFTVMVDQQIVKAFSGDNPWQTCAIPLEEAGIHTVSFVYSKNDLDYEGYDLAALDDVALLTGEAAQAALDANPDYPLTLENCNVSLEFLSSDVHEIVFDDPYGALDAFYGADAYFIVPEGASSKALVQLGADCDAGAAFIRELDGSGWTLNHCAYNENGFFFTAPPVDPDLGWNALALFPSLNDAYGKYTKVYIYFGSERAADLFCREQVLDLLTGLPVSGITWDYVQE